MKKQAYIVLGTGYGDEGKGLAVDYLSRQHLDRNPVVIRFSGGHQASHTVIVNENRHIFSSFGSGTMRGVPTFWSKYCTFQPQAAYNEYTDLAMKCNPINMLYVDPECPVTTPYDMWWNRYQEDRRGSQRHGSVGVGIGATFARHEETHYRLYARDLKVSIIFEEKLKAIRDYYIGLNPNDLVAHRQIMSLDLTNFKAAAKEDFYELANPRYIFGAYSTFIFEGSQGILLDQDYGFFPYVTRSHTTSKNAIQLLGEYAPGTVPEVYYMTRAYATRHGAGPLHGETNMDLRNLETETNIYGDYQREFRYAPLNYDLLDYALNCDLAQHKETLKKTMFITCLDQLAEANANNVLKRLEKRFWPYVSGFLVNDTPTSETVRDYDSITVKQ